MKLFDYFFYRTYCFYKKKKDAIPIWSGCGVLTVLTVLSLFSFVIFISISFKIDIYLNKIVLLCISILSLFLFWRRYGKIDYVKELEQRYKDEEVGIKRLRGWLFVLYLILVLLIPISIGYMRHNLGMDI